MPAKLVSVLAGNRKSFTSENNVCHKRRSASF